MWFAYYKEGDTKLGLRGYLMCNCFHSLFESGFQFHRLFQPYLRHCSIPFFYPSFLFFCLSVGEDLDLVPVKIEIPGWLVGCLLKVGGMLIAVIGWGWKLL